MQAGESDGGAEREAVRMDMTGSSGIFAVPAEHFPGLVALIVTPLALWAVVSIIHRFADHGSASALRLSRCLRAMTFPAKAAVVAMVIGATVHAAIVPTHWGDERVLAVLFILDTLGFMGATVWIIASRPHWQLVSAAMLGGTVAGYAFYLAKGWETADPVGMTVSLIELSGFFLLLLSGDAAFTDPGRRNRLVLSSLVLRPHSSLGPWRPQGRLRPLPRLQWRLESMALGHGCDGPGSSGARQSNSPSQ